MASTTFYKHTRGASGDPCSTQTVNGQCFSGVAMAGCEGGGSGNRGVRLGLIEPNTTDNHVSCRGDNGDANFAVFSTCALGKTSWIFDTSGTIDIQLITTADTDPTTNVEHVSVCRYNAAGNSVANISATNMSVALDANGGTITVSATSLTDQATTLATDFMVIGIYWRATGANDDVELQMSGGSSGAYAGTVVVPMDLTNAHEAVADPDVTVSMTAKGGINHEAVAAPDITTNIVAVGKRAYNVDFDFDGSSYTPITNFNFSNAQHNGLADFSVPFTIAAYGKSPKDWLGEATAEVTTEIAAAAKVIYHHTVTANMQVSANLGIYPAAGELYVSDAILETTDGPENTRTALTTSQAVTYKLLTDAAYDDSVREGEATPSYWRARVRFLVHNGSSAAITNFKPVVFKKDQYNDWEWICVDNAVPIFSSPYWGHISHEQVNSSDFTTIRSNAYVDFTTSYSTHHSAISDKDQSTLVCTGESGDYDTSVCTWNTATNAWVFQTNIALYTAPYLALGPSATENISKLGSEVRTCTDGITWTQEDTITMPSTNGVGIAPNGEDVWMKIQNEDNLISGYNLVSYSWNVTTHAWENETIMRAQSSFYTFPRGIYQMGSTNKCVVVTADKFDFSDVLPATVWAISPGTFQQLFAIPAGFKIISITHSLIDRTIPIIRAEYPDEPTKLWIYNELTDTFDVLPLDKKELYFGMLADHNSVICDSGSFEYGFSRRISYTDGEPSEYQFLDYSTPQKYITSGTLGEESYIPGLEHYWQHSGMLWDALSTAVSEVDGFGYNSSTKEMEALFTVQGPAETARIVSYTLPYQHLDESDTTQQLGSRTYSSTNSAFMSFGISNINVDSIAANSEVEVVADIYIDFDDLDQPITPYKLELKLGCRNNAILDAHTAVKIEAYEQTDHSASADIDVNFNIVPDGQRWLAADGFPAYAYVNTNLDASAICAFVAKSYHGDIVRTTLDGNAKHTDLNKVDSRFYGVGGTEDLNNPITTDQREAINLTLPDFVNQVDYYGGDETYMTRIRILIENTSGSSKTIRPQWQYRDATAATPTWKRIGEDDAAVFEPIMMAYWNGQFGSVKGLGEMQNSDNHNFSTMDTMNTGGTWRDGTTLYFLEHYTYTEVEFTARFVLDVMEYNITTQAISKHSTVINSTTQNVGDYPTFHHMPGGDWFIVCVDESVSVNYRGVWHTTGTSWSYYSLPQVTSTQRSSVNFIEDDNGDPWAVYCVNQAFSTSNVYVAKWNGSGFDTSTELSTTASDLAFAYFESSTDEIRIIYRNGSGFYEVLFDTSAKTYGTPSYFLAASGSAAVYQGDWVQDVIDSDYKHTLIYTGSGMNLLSFDIGTPAYELSAFGWGGYEELYTSASGHLSWSNIQATGILCFQNTYYKNLHNIDSTNYYPANDSILSYVDPTDDKVYVITNEFQSISGTWKYALYKWSEKWKHEDDTTQLLGSGTYVTSNNGMLTHHDKSQYDIVIPNGSEVELVAEIQCMLEEVQNLGYNPTYEIRVVDYHDTTELNMREMYPTINVNVDQAVYGDVALPVNFSIVANGAKETADGVHEAVADFSVPVTMDPVAAVSTRKFGAADFTIVSSLPTCDGKKFKGLVSGHTIHSSFSAQSPVLNAKASAIMTVHTNLRAFVGFPPVGCVK